MNFLKTTLIIILGLAGALSLQAQEKSKPEYSFIRVNSTLQSHNFLRPWEKSAPTPRRGLGAILENNQVLVTAELVVNATYIELEHPVTGSKAAANIVAKDYEANLALLETIDADTSLFEGLVPLELDADTVRPGDMLSVWQIEDNGDGVATEVEVLRMSVERYFLESSIFLVYETRGSLQARANSFTLPVTKDGKLAGLLLSYSSKELTSSILPSPIIKAFLDDVADGEYTGFPTLGISFAQTIDEQLRRFCKIEEKEGGVFLRSVNKKGSAAKSGIEKGDVILAIDGHPIDSRGNYDHPDYGKISFAHLVRGDASVGDSLEFEIVRDGEVKTIDVVLERRLPGDQFIDPYMFDRGPKFMIFGGLIFQELTVPFLKSWGNEWATRAPFRLVHAAAHPERYEEEGREKLVFLTNVLKTPSTLGYENLGSAIVTKVNDVQIKNIEDLYEALENPQDKGIHKIEFDGYPQVIFVHDETSRMINEQLLQYGISNLKRLK